MNLSSNLVRVAVLASALAAIGLPAASASAAGSTDLVAGASATPNPATAGSLIDYTVSAHNLGPSVALNTQLVDQIPAGVTYVSGSSGCTQSAGVVTCAEGDLGVGAIASATIHARVNAATVGNADDSVSVTTDTTDTNSSNDSASVTVPVGRIADLSFVESFADLGFLHGQTDVLTLTTHNIGPSSSLSATAMATLPAGLTYVSDDSGPGATSGCSVAGATVTCPVGPTAVNHDTLVNVVVTGAANGIQAVSGSVAGADSDPDMTNNTGSASITVYPTADLTLTTSTPATIDPGNDITYTLTVNNGGPDAAPNTVITDPLPSGVTFVSADAGCTDDTDVVSCTPGSLASGASASYHVTGHVPASLAGQSLVNSVGAQSDIEDSDPTDNVTADTTNVTGAALTPTPTPSADPAGGATPDPVDGSDVSIVMTNDAPAIYGRSIGYTIRATNHGTVDAPNTVVTDSVPATSVYGSSSTSTGTCTQSNGTMTCALGTLAAGQSATVHVATVPFTTGLFVNSSAIRSSATDVNPANNLSRVATPIGFLHAAISVVKRVQPSIVHAGQNASYKIIVRNTGRTAAVGLRVCDTFPSQLTLRSAKGGTLSGNQLCFHMFQLKTAHVKVYSVFVKVKPGAANGTVTNRVSASAMNAPKVFSTVGMLVN